MSSAPQRNMPCRSASAAAQSRCTPFSSHCCHPPSASPRLHACHHQAGGLLRRQRQPRASNRRHQCRSQQTARQWPGLAAFGDGRWAVRQLTEDELMWAAQVQFEGFHEPQKLPPLNALSAMVFRAEVVSTLQQKLLYNTSDRFMCLVAERTSGQRQAFGVADVSLQKDKEVLRRLPEAVDQYAYLSSMAVDKALRRQGAAQALLSASERIAGTWKQRWLALHLFADNRGALQLYQQAGFQEIDRIAPFFLGRTRILMAKPVRR